MSGRQTPWGESLSHHKYAEGIIFYETGRHGGIKLSPQRNAEVHWALRQDDGWYEEDCEALKVIISFPSTFSMETPQSLKNIERELARWFPKEYRLWKKEEGGSSC